MERHRYKILLIEPPYYRLFKDTYSLDRYPLSLGYLAGTILKETKWDVMVYNSDFYFQSEPMRFSYLSGQGFDNYLNNLKDTSKNIWNEIRSTISEYNPDVIGISAKSQNFASACIVAKLSKEINGQNIVILGGPHVSMVGREVLKNPYIDIGVRGEGERTIVELLNAIEAKENLGNICGIVYRKNDHFIENPTRDFIKDLDSLCFPHESAPTVLKDYKKYPKTAFRNIFAIRGCPYSCFFCGSHKIWNHQVRFRSPENVVKEIRSLQKEGLKIVRFDDDTFGVNKKYIYNLCQVLIKECPDIKWNCELHVKLVNKEVLSLMKEAGCYSIQVGIESGNNKILKEINKNITIEEALSTCELIKKYGLELETFFMAGFPQETEDSFNDTVEIIKKIKCENLVYNIFTPYPGTRAFEFCRENRLIDEKYDASLHNHQSPLNYFCRNISPEKFRRLVCGVERIVDRKNSLNRIRRIFYSSTLKRMQELGIIGAFRKGIKVFVGKK